MIGLVAIALASCGGEMPAVPDASTDGGGVIVWALEVPAEHVVTSTIEVAAPATVSIAGLEGDLLVRLEAMSADATVSAPWLVPTDLVDGGFLARSRVVTAPLAPIAIDGPRGARARLTIAARATPPDSDIAHSLAWTDPAVAGDPAIVGAARVLRAFSDDGHGGRLFDRFLRRFGTTPHSERPALVELADAIAAEQGADPASWNLDELPLRVTAIHNRIDLRNDAHCGELRVSFTVTDRAFPFVHLLFLFAQGRADDVSELGIRHCEESAFRWAALATASDFVDRARAILDETLVRERFLLAESLERTVGTWEWRQWTPEDSAEPGLPHVLENPPLFQTIDVAAVNAAGPLRDDLLAWIAANADAIEARTIAIPPRFAPRSARATEGVLRAELDLSGLEPRIDTLRTALDRVGCPGCHERSPTFVQTSPDRVFSDFYMDELEARRAALDAFREATTEPRPFGALSD